MSTPDPKSMAKRLRADLKSQRIDVPHSRALELVAHQYGYRDWNTMAARGEVTASAAEPSPHSTGTARSASAIPIFRMFDLPRTLEFYVDFLGFTVTGDPHVDDHTPAYIEVEREGVRLHLSEHHGDATPGSSAIIDIADTAALQRELNARDYRFARPGLETKPWGLTVTVEDPASNRLIFLESRTGEAGRVPEHGSPIVSDINVPTDPATAYAAFIDLGRWWDARLTPNAATFLDIEVGSIGQPVVLVHEDGRFPIGTVTRREPGRVYAQTFTLAVDPEYPTTLTAEFAPAEGGTRVRLSHGGWVAGNVAERAKFTEWPALLRRYAATVAP